MISDDARGNRLRGTKVEQVIVDELADMQTKEPAPFADYPSAWSGKVEADFTVLEKMLLPPMAVDIHKCERSAIVPVKIAALIELEEAAWDAGRWGDDADYEVELEHTFAVFDSDAVDKDGNPIAMLHCHRCGKGGWADVDSITRYCPDCGRVVANCREWQEVGE